MSDKELSQRSRSRNKYLAAHRARGSAVGNLWALYSVKTSRDVIVSSDRKLIHFIHFLECNPKVRSFTIAPEPIITYENGKANEFYFDAEVHNFDNTIEWHIVRAAPSAAVLSDEVISISKRQFSNRSIVVFTDEDLAQHVKLALRWQKALGYAAVLQEREYAHYHSALVVYLVMNKFGTVEQLCGDMVDFESQILKGILIRLAITGVVKLDLRRCSFGPQTPWTWAG